MTFLIYFFLLLPFVNSLGNDLRNRISHFPLSKQHFRPQTLRLYLSIDEKSGYLDQVTKQMLQEAEKLKEEASNISQSPLASDSNPFIRNYNFTLQTNIYVSNITLNGTKDVIFEPIIIDRKVEADSRNELLSKLVGDEFLSTENATALVQTIMKSFETIDSDIDTPNAELFVSEYFDKSRQENAVGLSRRGASIFQQEIIAGCMEVYGLTIADGYAVFEGKILNSSTFPTIVQERFSSSPSNISDLVDYTVIRSEPGVLGLFYGSRTSIVVYPKCWNSTLQTSLNTNGRKIWLSFVSVAAALSSLVFSASSLGLFTASGGDADMTGAELSATVEAVASLSVLPLTIQLLASTAESIVARLRGFTAVTAILPAGRSLPLFGFRTIYTSMPKNRNDYFDSAAVGSFVQILASLLACYWGLHLTDPLPAAEVTGLPALPMALIRSNTFLEQIVASALPASQQLGNSALLHLNPIAVAGAVTFISAVLQLLPFDNSAGSKVAFAMVGPEGAQLVSAVAGLVKTFFMLSFILAPTEVVTWRQQLLFDYLLLSPFVSMPTDVQYCRDNISTLTEGRKVIFWGLVALLFTSFVPYARLMSQVDGFLMGLQQPATSLF